MLTLPPIPDWQAIHPLLVHFPIALLLVSPLFIVIGILQKPTGASPFMLAALILMGLGTLATFVAASSGEAARELAETIPKAEAVLKQHQALAESTEIVFTALIVIFAAILFVPRLMKAPPTRVTSALLPAAFLLLYAAGAVALINTAHQGGRLVHEFGVTAGTHTAAGQQANASSVERADRE